MPENQPQKLNGESWLPQSELTERLKQDFPEVFSEDGYIDPEKLKQSLGERLEDENGERYGLSWAGKKGVFSEIAQPTTKTLKPARDESVDFDSTEHVFIEGENLETLKVLQKAYYGKIKMIYIDPPYNTGHDFVYNDKFRQTEEEYNEANGDTDENGELTRAYSKNTKESGRYHSNWLNMMYPRLYLARNLLRDNGVIFVSVDDNEVHNLRHMMDEIFGEENFVCTFVWDTKKGAQGMTTKNMVVTNHEYILVYAKQIDSFNFLGLERDEEGFSNPDDDPRGLWKRQYLQRLGQGLPERTITDPETGREYTFETPYTQQKLNEWIKENRIIFPQGESGYPARKEFLEEYESKKQLSTDIGLFSTKSSTERLYDLFGETKIFTNPKPETLLQFILEVTIVSQHDIILDFFAGSGTTAHAVMAQNAEDGGNRKSISVQLPEEVEEGSEAHRAGYQTIADIAKERIRRAGKKIADEYPDKELDAGMQVYKLAESNFEEWRPREFQDAEALQQALEESVEREKEGATKENKFYELLLKSGFDLNAKIEEKGEYHVVNDGELVICLAETMTQEIVSTILAEKPSVVLCLDSAFAGNDELKTNTALQMKDAGVEFRAV